jgi:hypothetical protein
LPRERRGWAFADIGGRGLLGLLSRLDPRAAIVLGCAMLAMAGLAAAVTKDLNSVMGFGATGGLFVALGGLAWMARRSSNQAVESNPELTIAALCWLLLYGGMLVVMLTEPVVLHRAFGTEIFHLPIEFVLPAVLALVLLPLWPGLVGLASLLRQAMGKGRRGILGVIAEMQSAFASGRRAHRRMALQALWFFAYFILLTGTWIVYAAMLGI